MSCSPPTKRPRLEAGPVSYVGCVLLVLTFFQGHSRSFPFSPDVGAASKPAKAALLTT